MIGSSMASEIATMKVTEQIDALKTLSTMGLLFIVTKNIAIVRITIKEGSIVPNADINAPHFFAILLPTNTAIFRALIVLLQDYQ